MILERLRVEGFRSLAAPYEFVPDERLTIISAPNGTGKSTLLDALYHGLLEKHTVTGTVVTERFAARGRDLVPRIVIDFCVGVARYRLRKHFLGEKVSRLERWESGRYHPLKEGAASDDFVRELFAAEAPGRGALDAGKHWGLAHILWSAGGARYTALPSTASDQVRSMLSDVAIATLGERAVEERVGQRYQRYFTDSGAFARSVTSTNLPAREAEIAVAKTAVIEAASAVSRLDELRRSHEDSNWEATRLATKRADLRTRLAETKVLAAAFDALNVQRHLRAAAEQRWRELAGDLKRRIDTIAELRVKLAAIAGQRSGIHTQIEVLVHRYSKAADTLSASICAADAAASLCGDVQARAAMVTAAQTYAADLASVRVLREHCSVIESHGRDIDLLSRRRASILAPTHRELKALLESDIERRNLEAQIAASTLTLEIMPNTDAEIAVLAGGGARNVRLLSGAAEIVTGTEQIVVVISGFGRIEARGADSVAAARRKHAAAAARIGDALERFGATSIVEIEGRLERAAELDTQITMRRHALAERLGGEQPAAVRLRLLEAENRLAATESGHRSWSASPPDAAVLRAAFDSDLQRTADAAADAKLHAEAARNVRAAIAAQLDLLHDADRELVSQANLQSFRLDDLLTDGQDDAVRDSDLLQFSLEWNAARAQCRELDLQLHAFLENPHEALSQMDAQEMEAGRQYEEYHGRAQRDLALLEEFSQRGSYRQLAEAEETLDTLIELQQREVADAGVISLLWNTFADVRKERIADVLAPIERSASMYLSRIAGDALGSVRVRPDFSPLGVSHGPTGGDLVEIESTLSVGEREQIYIATRFALADVIAGTRGRQLLVLDDILTATDPARLRRFMTLLEELSRERLQIVITTADASRFLGVRGAKHVDLRAALSTAAAA